MQRDDRSGERDRDDLDEQMERDTENRRDTQVRGSLGMPPSGGNAGKPMDRDEGIPEFERTNEEDRNSER